MSARGSASWGLKAISVFYLVGIFAVTIALFTNRAAVGRQLAAVHGLPALAGVPVILLTIAMGALVVAGINSMRPWGYWTILAYMWFLLLIPPFTLGADRISVFANIAWPLLMTIVLFAERRSFGIGARRSV